MKRPTRRLAAAAADWFEGLRRIRASGAGTAELSAHGPLANLLNAVGASLKPRVICIAELAHSDAGRPDFGLFAARQVRRGRPRPGQKPERGVVEVKAAGHDLAALEASEQVARYRAGYGLVLATNLREFTLSERRRRDGETRLESFSLAPDEETFHRRLQRPKAFARRFGPRLVEYLERALTHRAAIRDPKDLANLLASYARDGLSRLETAGEAASRLDVLREALEEALGVRFRGDRGERFFRSTLVQTLFYGVFSAWVIWNRRTRTPAERFRWREAVWHLRAPVLRALFQQTADPGRLEPLGLVEVLDWTAAALDRVDRPAFFARFREREAVPYFYEPFLAAFDPDLRKQLGVWYTPPEVIRYMVARVDGALKDDLGIADGLAADNVHVLDPCCGTGAFLAEVLRRIAANLKGRGLGALAGARLREAANKRIFGFEILPAPFVVAHLQVGLALDELDAGLGEDAGERPQVFLTNALTGWKDQPKSRLLFPELQEERERAARVKQEVPILVILGNPPYNGFAGMAVDEERELTDAYRITKRVRRPEGQGLNDLYVRFFRMAERRIAEQTGRGIVCFISNYSWLDGLSFTGMRERYLEAFDAIRIDNLHGDRIISEYAPDGRTSETVFALRGQSPGIKVGTSIVQLVRSTGATSGPRRARVRYRDFDQARAEERRNALVRSLSLDNPAPAHHRLRPEVRLGLPFKPMAVSDQWFDWPALPDLFPVFFPGVKTSRDAFLVDHDLDVLKARLAVYFDPTISHGEIGRRYPAVMKTTRRFPARAVRDALLARGGPTAGGFVRYAYRPFDNRWLYWEAETKLLDEKRPDYRPQVFAGNTWLCVVPRLRRDAAEAQVTATPNLASLHLNEWGASLVPRLLRGAGLTAREGPAPNLSASARRYLERTNAEPADLFHHALRVFHDPEYREANAGALSVEWPRIPLPGWPDGRASGAAEALRTSAATGRRLAALLDPDTPVPGVTEGPLPPELAAIAVPATTSGRQMTGDDFAVRAGWGHFGAARAVMPGAGRARERDFTASERDALASARTVLGETTWDIHLNDRAFFRNVPGAVWRYRLGGYQVLKKWLSYREERVLGRPVRPDEVHHFTNTARRIAAILLLVSPSRA